MIFYDIILFFVSDGVYLHCVSTNLWNFYTNNRLFIPLQYATWLKYQRRPPSGTRITYFATISCTLERPFNDFMYSLLMECTCPSQNLISDVLLCFLIPYSEILSFMSYQFHIFIFFSETTKQI